MPGTTPPSTSRAGSRCCGPSTASPPVYRFRSPRTGTIRPSGITWGSSLLLEPGSHEFEHTFAHSKWGEAYAVQHAQLSLIGWGHNQQWDESSIGCWGESITYDPDMTLARAQVDDVRPFLVNAGTEWRWTGNVGGASFLVYRPSEGISSFPSHQLGRMRTHYAYTGPNLTKVIYAGLSRDGKIEAKITTQLGRTDDLVRAYYHPRVHRARGRELQPHRVLPDGGRSLQRQWLHALRLRR